MNKDLWLNLIKTIEAKLRESPLQLLIIGNIFNWVDMLIQSKRRIVKQIFTN